MSDPANDFFHGPLGIAWESWPPKPVSKFVQYRRKQIAELRPYEPGETLEGVSISQPDQENGSPKLGDRIARNPKNHADKWLVAAQYFADNFEPIA